MRIEAATQPVPRPTSVDPSRAWILGLVVDPDGSVSAPMPADSEWPSAWDAADLDQTMTPDGPSVRP
jgi:hypothetical protein